MCLFTNSVSVLDTIIDHQLIKIEGVLVLFHPFVFFQRLQTFFILFQQ